MSMQHVVFAALERDRRVGHELVEMVGDLVLRQRTRRACVDVHHTEARLDGEDRRELPIVAAHEHVAVDAGVREGRRQ